MPKMVQKILWLVYVISITPICNAGSNDSNLDNYLVREYKSYTIILDCVNHGAVSFNYTLKRYALHLNYVRNFSFIIDPDVPEECQLQTSKTYRTDQVLKNTGTWDRGRLVPEAITENKYITNILPQNTEFKTVRGAWKYTEALAECFNDDTDLKIWGGVIWGHDINNDFFVKSHGITTPDYWWKLIYRNDSKKYYAWVFPNDKFTTSENINWYRVSLKELDAMLEKKQEFSFDVNMKNYSTIENSSWEVKWMDGKPRCNKVQISQT